MQINLVNKEKFYIVIVTINLIWLKQPRLCVIVSMKINALLII